MAFVKKTTDERIIGIEIIELKSFPDLNDLENRKVDNQMQAQEFLQLIQEFRNRYNGNSAVFEILWITHSVNGQAYNSEIKIYLIFREIGINASKILLNLKLISGNICSLLSVQNYTWKICECLGELKKDFVLIDSQCVYGLRKAEKYILNPSTQTAMFYNDILEHNQYSTFENLVSRFSELRDCAISFQIMPEELDFQEKIVLGEMMLLYENTVNRSDRDIKNIAFADLLQSISSYYNAAQGALYGYNILVFGKKESAHSLITRINSMLKSYGGGQASFDVVDFSRLNIKLYSDIYIYPWNARVYVKKCVNYLKNINNCQKIFRKLNLLMLDKEILNFFRLPVCSKNTLALNNEDSFYVSEHIDEDLLHENNVKLGMVNTVNGILELGCAKEQFAKHALIVGTPGTGKTTFSLNLLLQFYRKGIPFLAIEPTKTEYRALIEKVDELQIFTPGNNEISPFIINPFIPPREIKIEQYIPALVNAFGAAFSMESPLDVIFLKAIRAAYVEYGWKDYSKYGDCDVREFGLYEFIMVFKRIVQESNYGREIKGNLESGGTFRLLNLIEQNGNIYDTIKNVPIEDILKKPTILELNAIQDERQKALIIALILSNICLYTKLIQRGDGNLKNIILIDEAHVLLGNSCDRDDRSNPKGTAINSLKAMIAEIRSYGTGIIIADQSAKMVSREIVANTDIKIAFRLVETEEKEILGNSINADERIKSKMSKLKMGEAFVFLSKLEKPQLVSTPDVRAKENIKLVVSDLDVIKKMKYWSFNKELLKPFRECSSCDICNDECDYHVRSDANYYANKIFSKCAKELTDKVEFVRYIQGIEVLLKSAIENYDENKRERLIKCSMIQLRRKVQMETKLVLSDNEMKVLLKKG